MKHKTIELIKMLIILTAFDAVLLLTRLYRAGAFEHKRLFDTWDGAFIYGFLAWNLMLAWVPFIAALVIHSCRGSNRKTKILYGSATTVWFFFLPNAPYILTDMIHLRHRPPVPYWYDGLMLFSFALTGLLLFFFSVYFVHHSWRQRFGIPASRLLVLALMLLCGYGIYIGRFQRWNSWDLVLAPKRIILDTIHVIFEYNQHTPDIGLPVVFCFFLCVLYYVFVRLLRV